MIPIEGQPILAAAQVRAAEERVAPTPEAVYALVERAGAGIADAVRRLAVGAEVLILCGPGNNGADGYVAARLLQERGHPLRIAALGEPTTDLARRARRGWTGPVESFAEAVDLLATPVLVDAVFGTGLSRPVDNDAMQVIAGLVGQARLSIAVDLPSGVDADSGAELNASQIPAFDVTLALGALKPAHVLMPAAEQCGAVRLIDIGLGLDDVASPRENVSPDGTIAHPHLHAPYPWDHKYSRGMVVVIGGDMPGAAGLAIQAAMRAGAGYGLLLLDEADPRLPYSVVRRPWSQAALRDAVADKRSCVVVVGPGLGRGQEARTKLDAAIACDRPLVIDGDALHLLEEEHFTLFRARGDVTDRDRRVVLTPHAGEFAALFGKPARSKIDAAREAARRSGAIVVFKGPGTVIAHPNGHTKVAVGGSSWLSTAGTGDVLAGTIAGTWHAAALFGNVEAGVWLHAEAARRCGASFIADDLAAALTPARASL